MNEIWFLIAIAGTIMFFITIFFMLIVAWIIKDYDLVRRKKPKEAKKKNE